MGVSLTKGQSHARDRREFEKRHSTDWVVVAALNSDHRPGFVECFAAEGGTCGGADERRFLVPTLEYATGPHGFVTDPLSHEPYDGPFSFATWAARR